MLESNSIKKFDAWHMPAYEHHLPQWMTTVNKRVDGRLTYQYGKYESALVHCKQKRVAIDVGAHIGLWSYFMAADFSELIAFEPVPPHKKCWLLNMDGISNAELWPYALGDCEKLVTIETRTEGSSGDSQIKLDKVENSKAARFFCQVPQKKLDFFELHNVDFIKIDCEGYEEFVLRGGEETLRRCKPCVVVEQKADMSQRYGLERQSAVTYLKSLGAQVRGEISGDFILSWD